MLPDHYKFQDNVPSFNGANDQNQDHQGQETLDYGGLSTPSTSIQSPVTLFSEPSLSDFLSTTTKQEGASSFIPNSIMESSGEGLMGNSQLTNITNNATNPSTVDTYAPFISDAYGSLKQIQAQSQMDFNQQSHNTDLSPNLLVYSQDIRVHTPDPLHQNSSSGHSMLLKQFENSGSNTPNLEDSYYQTPFDQQNLGVSGFSTINNDNTNEFLDLESPDTNDDAIDGAYLIPTSHEMKHYRTTSMNSDISSVAHSPLLSSTAASASPYHSATASPYINPEVHSLEQLTTNFSLGDSTASAHNLNISQVDSPNDIQSFPPYILSLDNDNNLQEQTSVKTPEISIDYVDIQSSPMSVPRASRPRSLSDNNGYQRGRPGLNVSEKHDLNLALADTAVDASNYLSPDAAAAALSIGRPRSSSSLSSGSGSRIRSSSAHSVSTSGSRSRSRSHSRSPGRSNKSRDYILELASPSQSKKRVQKHPSAYACDLCDKRFTRAYNLRSHLRSHTDERPFVCTVCSKAFARQHDRKRHEALHSGEKEFECKGLLADGITPWGCGKQFARADALGRHFRTEAGKECIKPLLEEELRARAAGSGLSNLGQPNEHVPLYFSGEGGAPSLLLSPPSASNDNFFPSALLEQFPTLVNLKFDHLSDDNN